MPRKYRAAIFMAILAIASLLIHLYTGWQAAMDEASTHGQDAIVAEYLVQWVRDTFENLQSEFWQLAMQMALLAGVFEAIGVKAYEQDTAEIKQRLSLIEDELYGLDPGDQYDMVRETYRMVHTMFQRQ